MLFVIYEYTLRIHVCKKKIYNHIKNIGGQIISIEKLSPRDEIFSVAYNLNGKSEYSTVKFSFFYKTKWF